MTLQRQQTTVPAVIRQDVSQPPQEERAERALLGGLLSLGATGHANEAFRSISYLKPQHFFLLRHKYIFRAMELLFEDRQQIDIVTVGSKLDASATAEVKPLEMVGESYLRDLLSAEGGNLTAYANLIAKAALRRRIIAWGNDAIQFAVNTSLNLIEVAEHIEEIATDILMSVHTLTDQKSISLVEALNEDEAKMMADLADPDSPTLVHSTGYRALDDLIGGLYRTDLVIVAGRPSMGKTSFLLNLGLNAMRGGARPIMLNCEMPRDQLIRRFLMMEAEVDGTRLRKLQITPTEFDRLKEARQRLKAIPTAGGFFIADMKKPTLKQIESKLREHYYTTGFDLVLLDYLGITMIAPSKPGLDMRIHMAETAAGLKELAKEFNVPLVTAAQLNRDNEKRNSKRPQLSDLAESGGIENAADLVLFIHREEMYATSAARSLPNPGRGTKAEIILAKQRNGAGGLQESVFLEYRKQFTKFVEWTGV